MIFSSSFFSWKEKFDWHKSNNVFEEKKEKTDQTNKNILEDLLN